MNYQEYKSFYGIICDKLLTRYPGVSKVLVRDAVSEAILFFLSQQQSINPILLIDDSTANSIYEKAREKLRYELKRNKKILIIEENEFQTTIYHTNLEEQTIHNKLLIEEITKKVPKVYRDLLSLILQGFKYKDISEALCISVSAIQKRAERLRKWLSNHRKDFE
ncbi:MAG: sigma factor-like helix-turn-helix DNA-binding protein [Candidatus Kapaibacteriota bacterium]